MIIMAVGLEEQRQVVPILFWWLSLPWGTYPLTALFPRSWFYVFIIKEPLHFSKLQKLKVSKYLHIIERCIHHLCVWHKHTAAYLYSNLRAPNWIYVDSLKFPSATYEPAFLSLEWRQWILLIYIISLVISWRWAWPTLPNTSKEPRNLFWDITAAYDNSK